MTPTRFRRVKNTLRRQEKRPFCDSLRRRLQCNDWQSCCRPRRKRLAEKKEKSYGANNAVECGTTLCTWRITTNSPSDECATVLIALVFSAIRQTLTNYAVWVKKVAPLKLFAYFHSRWVYFHEILPVCCQFISTHIYQFSLIYLNI